jgi:hypothetical protein
MVEDKSRKPGDDCGDGARTVRDRTMAHMEYLLRMTTFGAGMALAWSAQAGQAKRPQVCDPVPPPMTSCQIPDEQIIQHINWWASWKKSEEGWFINLLVYTRNARNPISFDGITRQGVKVTGAKLASIPKGFDSAHQSIGLMLLPDDGEKTVEVELSFNCSNKSVPLKLRLDIQKPPVENERISVISLKII